MKLCVVLILGTLAILGVTSVHAQAGCPPGKYPVAGPGWSYCADVPGSNDQPAAANQSAPRLANNWIAIAVDLPNGFVGTATSLNSSDRAKQLAILDCKSKGGTSCKSEVSVENGCVAMTVGASMMNTEGAGTKEDAEKKSMQQCSAVDSQCHVYFSGCALPQRLP